MRVERRQWKSGLGWSVGSTEPLAGDAQVVFVFGAGALLKDPARVKDIREMYPRALRVGCSTAGEIFDVNVSDETLVASALSLDKGRVVPVLVPVPSPAESRRAGEALAAGLPPEGLVHVVVLSDGLHVNGSDLVRGLTSGLPRGVRVTGGLSADGDRFVETGVLLGDDFHSRAVVAIGFYGERLRVGFGSLGGWDTFGPRRLITKSNGNVLECLDGKSALEIYKNYLGEYAAGLPATGLLFPLAIQRPQDPEVLVRSVLAVDEKKGTMTFAGDMPEGCLAQFMMANFDRMVDGAESAAGHAKIGFGASDAEWALLISCVGRKLILKQRVEEEVEAVRDVLGPRPVLVGFYSYGEIAPFRPDARCDLHNQTMTITTFTEIP